MFTRTVKRGDEGFEVAVSEDSKTATVTDKLGTIVSISYNSGNLNVRSPNGWGAWKSSMPSAVDYAIDLGLEASSPRNLPSKEWLTTLRAVRMRVISV